MTFAIVGVLAVTAVTAAGAPDAAVEAMLARVDAAQRELQNGRVEPFKALWSRSRADDVTLSDGFGGAIEKGWEAVSRRQDWVGTQFSKGRHENDSNLVKAPPR